MHRGQAALHQRLIFSSTGLNSSGSFSLALHSLRSRPGPRVGRTRRSWGSVVAITQSTRQSFHFPLLKPGR